MLDLVPARETDGPDDEMLDSVWAVSMLSGTTPISAPYDLVHPSDNLVFRKCVGHHGSTTLLMC